MEYIIEIMKKRNINVDTYTLSTIINNHLMRIEWMCYENRKVLKHWNIITMAQSSTPVLLR